MPVRRTVSKYHRLPLALTRLLATGYWLLAAQGIAAAEQAAVQEMDTDQYCREIETHLCRRNGGHLVRVAGPAFEMVRGWAQRGIPLKVAFQGIDRYVD